MLIKFYLPFLLLFVVPCFGFGQTEITLKGKITDGEKEKPIPYASIGIPSKYTGSVSGPEGDFVLTLSPEHLTDTLQFTAIGYHTKKIPIASITDSAFIQLSLQPKKYQMGSILVTDEKPKQQWIGKKVRPVLSPSYGSNIGHDEIGAAYAFRVNWEDSLPLKLLYGRMFLKENENEKLRMRCRIAEVDPQTDLPGDDIMQKSVITVTEKKGWITCNFKEHDIYVDQRDFFIIFEWLPDEGQTYTPMFAIGLNFNSVVYDRRSALGEWKENPNDLIYSLKVEY